MATSPIDLSAGFVPKQSGDIDLSAGFVPKTNTPPTQDPLAKLMGQQKQTDLERWLQPTPHSADQGVMGNVGTALSNIGAAGLNALTHPEQMVTGAVMSSPPIQAYQDVKSAIQHISGQPNAIDDAAANPAQTVEGAIGTAGALAAPELAGEGIAATRNYLRPPTSPSIVPPSETAARNLAAAVLPATKDAANFIRAAQQEVPNVLDYAKRTDNPLNTQLEFSKAAQGYAQEVRGLYQDQILGPVQNRLVKTSGTGFGSRMNEGPDTYATLGDIDKQVAALNRQLDTPALNADDARRALATKTAMQSEVRGLTNILHQNLAESSGLPPEQIADLRQRVGRSYELANDTDAAVTARQQAAGKSGQVPPKLSQLPSKAFDFAMGGPVPIADRAFQRAIASFPGEAQPLPQINAPATAPPSRVEQLLADSKARFAARRAAFQQMQNELRGGGQANQ